MSSQALQLLVLHFPAPVGTRESGGKLRSSVRVEAVDSCNTWLTVIGSGEGWVTNLPTEVSLPVRKFEGGYEARCELNAESGMQR